MNYSLYDVYGKLILNQKANLQKGDNQLQINTTDLNRGIYFVRIITENNKTSTYKIIK